MATILTKSLREQRKGKNYEIEFRAGHKSNKLAVCLRDVNKMASCHYNHFGDRTVYVGINNIDELNKAVPNFTSEIVKTRTVGNEYIHNVHYIDDEKLNVVCEYFYYKEKVKEYNNLLRKKRDGYYAQYFDALNEFANYLNLNGNIKREFIVNYGSKSVYGNHDQDDLDALRTLTIARENNLRAFRLGRSGHVAKVCRYLGYGTERRKDETGYNVYKGDGI